MELNSRTEPPVQTTRLKVLKNVGVAGTPTTWRACRLDRWSTSRQAPAQVKAYYPHIQQSLPCQRKTRSKTSSIFSLHVLWTLALDRPETAVHSPAQLCRNQSVPDIRPAGASEVYYFCFVCEDAVDVSAEFLQIHRGALIHG